MLRAPWKTETTERRHYGEPISIPDDWIERSRLTGYEVKAINDNFSDIIKAINERRDDDD